VPKKNGPKDQQKAPHHAGLFFYFGFDDDLMRSSSFKNSAVSSSFGLEGGLLKGIISDTVELPATKSALYVLTPPQLPHFCGERLLWRLGISTRLALGSFCQLRPPRRRCETMHLQVSGITLKKRVRLAKTHYTSYDCFALFVYL
jgi:hypothetical protein